MPFLRAMMLSFAVLASPLHAACGEDGRDAFARLFSALHPTENQKRFGRIARSQIVDRAIADPASVFHDFHASLRNYDKRIGKKKVAISDGAFAIQGEIYAEHDALVIKVGALKTKGLGFGTNPKGLDSSLYKFMGTLLRGVDENLVGVPNDFKSVKIIGSTVVNKRLSKTLAKFGFAPESKQSPVVRGVGLAGMKVSTAASVVFLGNFGLFPLTEGPLLKMASDSKSWVLELPLTEFTGSDEIPARADRPK